MLGHKASLGKCKEIEIISSCFSDHSAMRWEINYKGKTSRKHKHMAAKQYATKQPLVHWRNQKKLKKIPRDKWKWKHNTSKPTGCSKSNYNIILLQEIRKISDKPPNLTPKTTR